MKNEITLEEAMERAFDLLEETEYVKYTKVWTRERMIKAMLESNTKDTNVLKRYINIEDKLELGISTTWKTYLLFIIEYKWCPTCKTCQDINNFMSNGKYCNNCKEKINKRNRDGYNNRGNKGKTIIKDFQQTIVEDISNCSNNELLCILKELRKFLDEEPVQSMMTNDNNLPGKTVYKNRFGSWSSALDLSKKEIILDNEETKRPRTSNGSTEGKFSSLLANTKTKGDMLESYVGVSRTTRIGTHARSIMKFYEPEMSCCICGYTTYVECCHIIPISEFSSETLVMDINSKDNLVWLCPNHHKEFDNGLILLDAKQ